MSSFRARHGLTLMELLIVITIIAVVAGSAMPGVLRMVTRSNLSSAAKELQAVLYQTRNKSMQSGEPLVFHYQPETGSYEIIPKMQYDQMFPPMQKIQDPLHQPDDMRNLASLDDNMAGYGGDGVTGNDGDQSGDVAGSSAPTLGSLGSGGSMSDLMSSEGSLPTAGGMGDAPTLGELGDAPTLGGLLDETSNTQQIAALPISKVAIERKMLPHELIFKSVTVSPVAMSPGMSQQTQMSQAGMSQGQMSPYAGSQDSMPANGGDVIPFAESPAKTRSMWSEPIFFFPNGRTSNARFLVHTTGRANYSYRVEISMRGLTGTANLGRLEPGDRP